METCFHFSGKAATKYPIYWRRVTKVLLIIQQKYPILTILQDFESTKKTIMAKMVDLKHNSYQM